MTNYVNVRAEWRAWADASDRCFATLQALWAQLDPSAAWNESQTETLWIQPVLAALGQRFAVQLSLQTPRGNKGTRLRFLQRRGGQAAAQGHGSPRPRRCWPNGKAEPSPMPSAGAVRWMWR
ncbi:MAG: hypothetical protein H6637_01125 [Ardenticatenales bacterium]|nr:hypothetical protein [Ardenticatenales bacterium]